MTTDDVEKNKAQARQKQGIVKGFDDIGLIRVNSYMRMTAGAVPSELRKVLARHEVVSKESRNVVLGVGRKVNRKAAVTALVL